ncbi:MAG: hypothetical protein WBP72_04270 [Rhodocyclaceae bacterium]|jgi:hypothetical protein
MFAITIIHGAGANLRRGKGGVQWAIGGALRAGFRIGSQVQIGAIEGRIVGFNIASQGIYHGALYPLLVATEFGMAKCSPHELQLAAKG